MPLINQKAQTVQVKGINKLIAKYGHNCDVVTGDVTTPSRLLFGKSKASLESGTLINSNEYRLLVKVVAGMPAPVPASTNVIVNGISFFIQTVMSIGPNAADPLVYELTCAAGSVPADVDSIETPSVINPTDNESDYSYVSTDGTLYSVAVTSSTMSIDTGVPTYVNADWQIALDSAFVTVVDSVSAVSGYTWTSGETLARDTNYYVRVRHNATGSAGAIVSDWSVGNLFSLDTIVVPPEEDIDTPSLTTPGGYLVSNDTYYSEYDPGSSGFVYKAAVYMSTFSSSTGKVFDHIHWIVRNDSGTVWEGDSAGGYDPATSNVFATNQLLMPYKSDYNPWYIKGKYVAVDATESAYCDEVTYFMD